MGFVGGGGNIAIATAVPSSSFVYCIVNIKYFMEFIYLSFYACMRLRFLDVKTNPSPQRPVPVVCRLHCSNVRGLAGNLSDLTVASSQYYILFCSETLISDIRHVSELVSRVRWPCLVLSGQDASGPWDGGIRIRDGFGAFRQPKFERDCCEMLAFRVCGVRQNL